MGTRNYPCAWIYIGIPFRPAYNIPYDKFDHTLLPEVDLFVVEQGNLSINSLNDKLKSPTDCALVDSRILRSILQCGDVSQHKKILEQFIFNNPVPFYMDPINGMTWGIGKNGDIITNTGYCVSQNIFEFLGRIKMENDIYFDTQLLTHHESNLSMSAELLRDRVGMRREMKEIFSTRTFGYVDKYYDLYVN